MFKNRKLLLAPLQKLNLALVATITNLLWLHCFAQGFGIVVPKSILLHYDNTSAIASTNNAILHARTKYIKIDFHFIQENRATKTLTIYHLAT